MHLYFVAIKVSALILKVNLILSKSKIDNKINILQKLEHRVLGISSFSYADTDAERTALAKIIHELDALKPLILEAQSQANPDKRPATQYDWLLLDIHRVRSGVEELLLPPRTQPRSFPPLKGDYRH